MELGYGDKAQVWVLWLMVSVFLEVGGCGSGLVGCSYALYDMYGTVHNECIRSTRRISKIKLEDSES